MSWSIRSFLHFWSSFLIVVAIVSTVGSHSVRIQGGGVIRTVGLKAFIDPDLTVEATTINWGHISPGDNSSVTLYLKSTSTIPAELTFSTENWQPSAAQQFFTLTWNYNHQPLNPGQVVPVTFTLRVSENVTGVTTFTFDLLITIYG